MTKYYEVTLLCMKNLKGREICPKKAWHNSCEQILGTNKSVKNCPRSTFLGLCQEGIVKGVKKDNYTSSVENKEYALKGIMLLKGNPNLTKKELWQRVCSKHHNCQMDVVKALFDKGYINGV